MSKDSGAHKVRAWTDVIDRDDGVYIGRFRLFEEVKDLTVEVTMDNGAHVADSPYVMQGPLYHEGCACSEPDTVEWAETMECRANYTQVRLLSFS